MTEKDLLGEVRDGESKTLELKESLPSQAERWVKTVVAFSNSAGGKLVVGVRDDGEPSLIPLTTSSSRRWRRASAWRSSTAGTSW